MSARLLQHQKCSSVELNTHTLRSVSGDHRCRRCFEDWHRDLHHEPVFGRSNQTCCSRTHTHENRAELWPSGNETLALIFAVTKFPRTVINDCYIVFLRECSARFGPPKVFVSDNGSQFPGHELGTFCKRAG